MTVKKFRLQASPKTLRIVLSWPTMVKHRLASLNIHGTEKTVHVSPNRLTSEVEIPVTLRILVPISRTTVVPLFSRLPGQMSKARLDLVEVILATPRSLMPIGRVLSRSRVISRRPESRLLEIELLYLASDRSVFMVVRFVVVRKLW